MDFDFALSLAHMLTEQIVHRGIRQENVLNALRSVPRHQFVPEEFYSRAYDDGPLPIGFSQTISQPYIVALMTSLLNLKGDETVLEIGCGSGYQAAVLSHLAKKVYTVELIPELAARARNTLAGLKLENVVVVTGDGSLGLPDFAPYQGIIVTAAAPRVPQPLLDQLSEGGLLVVPVGPRSSQQLERWERFPSRFECETMIPVSFVPLRGQEGWKADEYEDEQPE